MIPWLDHPGLLLYRLTPWLVAPRVVVTCNAPLTVLSSRFLLLPSETDSPVSAGLCTPGALTHLPVRCS